MSPQEMDALVERIGDEILARLQAAPPSAAAPKSVEPAVWPRPRQGYAAVLETAALGPAITARAVDEVCVQARELGVRAVWTAASWTPRAYRGLRGGPVRLGASIGYPYGDSTPVAKRAEAEMALSAGAIELLTVFNAGAWLSGERERAYVDLLAVCGFGAPVTAVLDVGLFPDDDLVRASIAAGLAGAATIQCVAGPAPHRSPDWRKVRLAADAAGDEHIVAAGGVAGFAEAAWCAAAGARRLMVADPAGVLRDAPRD
jgi:deoxyribose-phosphate aldolase